MTRLTVLRSGPLGTRNFRLLSSGQLASTVGDYCYAVALPWLVLSAHGSAVLLGGVLACYGIPRAALITVGGSLADRVGPRKLMLCSDAARCLLTVLFAAFAAAHVTSLVALGPVAALLGAGAALFMPASYAILPSLLPRGQLQAGNALYNAAVQGGTLLGPAIGGALVAAAGPAEAFALDAATYAPAARRSWIAVTGYVDQNNNVTQVCTGTGKFDSKQYYLDRKRETGNLHGQAPVLWAATALLRDE